ncbi:hypothetical protein [Sneathiella glossodoripedis]|uniref:hypothetical protein n=1 Tax=Sneathiella glossodoripedis TaxID=418853 RepID=UPI0004715C1F|nr:hypothetical protein [Sneathiella glossodoripedis]
MSEENEKFHASMFRPIDCSDKTLNAFAKIVLANGEVPAENLQRGIPTAEMLFFCSIGRKLVGVSCARFQNTSFHKLLFDRAGVPQMYNPFSVEICWLSVLPKYQGKGAWSAIYEIRRKYLKDRPAHGITRVENKRVADVARYGYQQVGEPFKLDNEDHFIRLVVKDHDPVFNPSKRLRYC